jgi:hypothetical protein
MPVVLILHGTKWWLGGPLKTKHRYDLGCDLALPEQPLGYAALLWTDHYVVGGKF